MLTLYSIWMFVLQRIIKPIKCFWRDTSLVDFTSLPVSPNDWVQSGSIIFRAFSSYPSSNDKQVELNSSVYNNSTVYNSNYNSTSSYVPDVCDKSDVCATYPIIFIVLVTQFVASKDHFNSVCKNNKSDLNNKLKVCSAYSTIKALFSFVKFVPHAHAYNTTNVFSSYVTYFVTKYLATLSMIGWTELTYAWHTK